MTHRHSGAKSSVRSIGSTVLDKLAAVLGITVGALLGAMLGVFFHLAAAVTEAAIGRDVPSAAQAVQTNRTPEPLRPGWSRPVPERLVKPTYWPMVLALGIAFVLWGVVSSLIISVIGLILFALALANWIWELHHDL